LIRLLKKLPRTAGHRTKDIRLLLGNVKRVHAPRKIVVLLILTALLKGREVRKLHVLALFREERLLTSRLRATRKARKLCFFGGCDLTSLLLAGGHLTGKTLHAKLRAKLTGCLFCTTGSHESLQTLKLRLLSKLARCLTSLLCRKLLLESLKTRLRTKLARGFFGLTSSHGLTDTLQTKLATKLARLLFGLLGGHVVGKLFAVEPNCGFICRLKALRVYIRHLLLHAAASDFLRNCGTGSTKRPSAGCLKGSACVRLLKLTL
jgi:hypothetical protein